MGGIEKHLANVTVSLISVAFDKYEKLWIMTKFRYSI